MYNLIHLVLSGGSGTRLWPLSRLRMPKQYLPLVQGKSLFQDTLDRHRAFCTGHMVVTNTSQFALAKQQAGDLVSTYILEAVGRNTAPAIAMACRMLDPETLVLVTPSDHLIQDREAYRNAVTQAIELAQDGFLVTFGVNPEYPETGFGYIQAEGHVVLSFREKPDLPTAQAYLAEGGYYWNAGIFCFKAGVFLHELKRNAPELYQVILETESLNQGPYPEGCIQPTLEEMLKMTDISIDYAVLEKSEKVRVVPCRMGWSDLGSFDALYAELPHDNEGNTLTGQPFLPLRSSQNLLLHYGPQVLITQDIQNLLVVTTQDAIYIGPRGQSQGIREVVREMQQVQPELLVSYPQTVTSWGQVKILEQSLNSVLLSVDVQGPIHQPVTLRALDLLEHPRIDKLLKSWPEKGITLRGLNMSNSGLIAVQGSTMSDWVCRIETTSSNDEQRCLVLIQKN